MLHLDIQHISYLGIILMLVLTGAGLPIPEEVMVILAGVASNQGVLEPWLAFGSCLIGGLLGDLFTYSIGRHFGRSVVREHPWVARFLTPEREAHIEEMINKHGLKVFFLARFLVGLRSPMYLTAGILRFPFRIFLLVDAVCASTVIGLFFGLSYVFGDRIQGWFQWIRQAEIALTVTVAVAVVSVVAFIYVRHRRRQAWLELRRKTRADRSAGGEPGANGKADASSATPEPAKPVGGK